MSNTRTVRQDKAQRTPCAVCGHGIRPGRSSVPLPDGRTVCSQCADRGVLARRLHCGHIATPGTTIIREGGMFRCARCVSPDTTAYLANTRKAGHR